MTPRTHAIRVILSYGPHTNASVFQGGDEREVCIQAEKLMRLTLMQGGAIGIEVSARDPEVEKRIRAYLDGVGHEIQSWPGERRPARIR